VPWRIVNQRIWRFLPQRSTHHARSRCASRRRVILSLRPVSDLAPSERTGGDAGKNSRPRARVRTSSGSLNAEYVNIATWWLARCVPRGIDAVFHVAEALREGARPGVIYQ
jgi:hypothetical protein